MIGVVIFWTLLINYGGASHAVRQPDIDLREYAAELLVRGPLVYLALGWFCLLVVQPGAGNPVAPCLRRVAVWSVF